jgi:secreted trypsin-like serine protease
VVARKSFRKCETVISRSWSTTVAARPLGRCYELCNRLIAGDIILSAAACPYAVGQDIYLGGIQYDGSDATATVTIVSTKVHPLYGDVNTLNNNFRLIKIDQDMSGIEVPPLNIDPSFPSEGTTCENFGYGRTETDTFSPFLREVPLAIVDQDTCAEAYGDFITNAVICAGGEFGRGTCSGDSGSPLICDGKIVGVNSFVSGLLGCAASIPDVRTFVLSLPVFFLMIVLSCDVGILSSCTKDVLTHSICFHISYRGLRG